MSVQSILSELRSERDRIDAAIKALESIAGPAPRGGASSGGRKRRKKRVMSAEARARIAAAQKKRWAKQKAGK